MTNRQLPRFRMIEYDGPDGCYATISDYSEIIAPFNIEPRTDAEFVLQAMNDLHERREAERQYAAERHPCCGTLKGMWHQEDCPERHKTSAGKGYADPPTVVIVNKGSDYQGTPVGAERFYFISPGQGYTTAPKKP